MLGSCGAFPELGCACSGLAVDWDGYRLVLDLGYATLPRLLAHWPDGVVDAVAVTHEHPDHCVDLMMMVPGSDGAVDATWKYSVWADRAGVHGPWANSARPGTEEQGPALIGSAAGMALAVVVSAEDVPAQAANVAPKMTDATAVARIGRDGLCCR